MARRLSIPSLGRAQRVAVASIRAALNSTGVRQRGIYPALAELARRYEVSPLDVTPSELKVFSQNGEDGAIQEILRRVGDGDRTFIEFGVESGVEANCVFLARVLGWRGAFIEADAAACAQLRARYSSQRNVEVIHARLTPENTDEILRGTCAGGSPSVLSIDVDGNDYYLWESISSISPRVVVIEYNAALDPGQTLVQPYLGDGADGSSFFGASLGALELLAARKGYRLVHTELAGVNAFFVRADIAGELFLPLSDVPRRGPDYFLDAVPMHAAADPAREYVDLSARRS